MFDARPGVKPYLPPPPPNNGLGLGAKGESAHGDRMSPLGSYHLAHTETAVHGGGRPLPRSLALLGVLTPWAALGLVGLLLVSALLHCAH
jgi:hypothetical protein